MEPITLYHGTTQKKAKQIAKQGFIPGKTYNWDVESKKGFVYLSMAYAPFYAMSTNSSSKKLALIKVSVEGKDCYPEDDFVMRVLGKATYTREELDKVKLEDYKHLWSESLKYMGNTAIKPNKAKILGIRYFDSRNLIMKCDPCITPMNFMVMGKYYQELSDWIFEGKEILEFNQVTDIERMFQNG